MCKIIKKGLWLYGFVFLNYYFLFVNDVYNEKNDDKKKQCCDNF